MNTDEIILIKLNKIAQQKEVKLTLTHKIFFLKLLKYAIENGDELVGGYSITKTERELSEILGISFRMVTQSIQVLLKCEVIGRIPGEKKFPRSPIKTIVYKSILEGEK